MNLGLGIGLIIGIGIILFLVGGVLAFIFTKKMFEKQLRENPPITEKMIRAMFLQMGRKPSEAQIKAVMRSMQQAKKEPNKK
ncbi:MAG: YneF family protein [Mycoplasmataceae bacterium]|nr:YneF family protein [Mycoplasmataceae bacterium]MBR3259383.1 YneF family protein [Mycoplasmataceae bacterium]MBR3832013.1 YneF family protein [Mycoplasmataceae bacterium]